MAKTLEVQQSRVIPVSVDDAFAGTLPIPLTTVFSRWYGPIGPVKEVRDQSGDWAVAGQTRTVMLSPTGSFHEELTRVDPPHSFGYALTGITGPIAISPTYHYLYDKAIFAFVKDPSELRSDGLSKREGC